MTTLDLKIRLQELGRTQKDLAELLGMKNSELSRLLHPKGFHIHEWVVPPTLAAKIETVLAAKEKEPVA